MVHGQLKHHGILDYALYIRVWYSHKVDEISDKFQASLLHFWTKRWVGGRVSVGHVWAGENGDSSASLTNRLTRGDELKFESILSFRSPLSYWLLVFQLEYVSQYHICASYLCDTERLELLLGVSQQFCHFICSEAQI